MAKLIIKEKQTKKKIIMNLKTHGDALKKKIKMKKHFPDADFTIV